MAAEKRGIPVAFEPQRLLDRVRNAIRRLHYSRRTEESYIHCMHQCDRFGL